MSIKGSMVGGPPAIPDWNETDPTSASFIKNKPNIIEGSGGTVEGTLNVPNPTSAMNAANKNYVDTQVSAVKTIASNAQSAASTAQSAADSAKSAASTAQSTANSAQSAASTAQSTANSALSTANSAEKAKLKFQNVVVYTTYFSNTGTYSSYPYRASISLSGVTSDMTPEVVLPVSALANNDFAPVAECYNGGVYIYADSVPSASFTIPTILCWR